MAKGRVVIYGQGGVGNYEQGESGNDGQVRVVIIVDHRMI